MRYEQLTPILDELKPEALLEVGTWNGERAIQMMDAAKGLVYFGFDLFEDANEETDARELNVKAHHNALQVRDRFNFPNQLYRGDTRDTLPYFATTYGMNRIDFAYIDGGHSVETIASDWLWTSHVVKNGGTIVLDDYYLDSDELDKYGCNTLVGELIERGYEIELLPATDPVSNGWRVQMVKVVV